MNLGLEEHTWRWLQRPAGDWGALRPQRLRPRERPVMLVSRSEDELSSAAREIAAPQYGTKVGYEVADLTRPSDIDRVLEAARERLGRVGALVTNSGGHRRVYSTISRTHSGSRPSNLIC